MRLPRRGTRIVVRDINEFLKRAPRMAQLIVDFDNTLVPYHGPERSQTESRRWVGAIISGLGVEHLSIVSNARITFNLRLPDLACDTQVIERARKPFTPGKSVWMGELKRGGARAVLGDQVLTDGLLALRFGVPFYHLVRVSPDEPLWPGLMRRAGELLARLVFHDEVA